MKPRRRAVFTEQALHPALTAQLRALGLSAAAPPVRAWRSLLQAISRTYEQQERATSQPILLRSHDLADEDLNLFEASPDAIMIFTPQDERIVAANAGAAELYGCTRERLLGMSLQAVSFDAEVGRQHVTKVMQAQVSDLDGWYRFETTHRRCDGEQIVVSIQARPIHYQGAPAVLTINRDVTELQRAQHALARSEERFAHVFAASPIAAGIVQRDGLIVDANPAMLSLLGLQAEEALGRRVFDLGLRLNLGYDVLTEIPEPPVRDLEVQLRSKRDDNLVVLVSAEWIEQAGEKQILLQLVDVSERKRTEAALRSSEARYRNILISVERQARESALLEQVRTIITRQDDLQAVLRAVVQGVRDYFGYDLVSVYLKQDEHLVLQQAVGYPTVISRIPLTTGVMARTLRTGSPLLIADVTQDTDFLSAIPGLRSEICVPLFVGGSAQGVLNVETIEETLTQHDLDLFSKLGTHVSIAIQRASLFAALQASNDRYDSLLSSLQEVVFQTNAQGNLTYLNPAWERQSGYRVEDSLGKAWTDYMHPDDRQRMRLCFARLVRRHETYYSIALRFINKAGQDRWTEITGRLNYSDDGEVLGATGTATDSTERNQAEQREREQRQLAEALVANAAALSVALNTGEALKSTLEHIQRVVTGFHALRMALLDSGMAHMVTYVLPGIPPGADVDIRAWDIEARHLPQMDEHSSASRIVHLPPDARALPGLEWVRTALVVPLRSREALLGYMYLDSADEHAFTESQALWVQGFADQLGTALYNLRLRADMARYAQELELRVRERTEQFRQAKDQIESILNTSSDSVALVNASGRILLVNRAFSDVLQTPSDPALLPPLTTFAVREDGPRLLDAIDRALTGTPQRIKMTARRSDGTTLPVEVAIDPLQSEEHPSSRTAVCGLHDITEHQNLENSLRAALEQERRLVDLKSRFGMMVSHEFRTPLATIQTSSDLLQNYHERMTAERRSDAIETITRQVRHLSALLDDILAISKADTVGLEFKPGPVDLLELTQFLAHELEWVDHQRHRLIVSVAEDVPKYLMLDRTLLQRALMNLLTNAVKYSPPETEIRFSFQMQDGQIQIEIRDQGIGIPAAEMPRLFDTFFRASNVGAIPGTGLGLAITLRAIEAHGGTINASSVAGEGTTFTMQLPAVPV